MAFNSLAPPFLTAEPPSASAASLRCLILRDMLKGQKVLHVLHVENQSTFWVAGSDKWIHGSTCDDLTWKQLSSVQRLRARHSPKTLHGGTHSLSVTKSSIQIDRRMRVSTSLPLAIARQGARIATGFASHQMERQRLASRKRSCLRQSFKL